MKIVYLQSKLVFFKKKYGKISESWTFSYSKTVYGENFLVSRLDLFALCVQGQRNGNVGIFSLSRSA